MSQSNLVVVQSYGTLGEALAAKDVLESSFIDAMIQADNAVRIQEHLAYSGLGLQVLVRERDVAVARLVLAMPKKNVLIHQATSEKKLHPQFCALLSAGIPPDLVDDGTYCQMFVSEENAAAARKVLECVLLTLPMGSPAVN